MEPLLISSAYNRKCNEGGNINMLTDIKQIFSPKIKHPYKTVQDFASCSHRFSNTINPLYMQQVKREMYEYVQSLSTKALCLYFLILVSNSYSQELEESIRLIMLEEIKKEIIQRYIPVSHPREKSLIYIYIYIYIILIKYIMRLLMLIHLDI